MQLVNLALLATFVPKIRNLRRSNIVTLRLTSTASRSPYLLVVAIC